MKKFFFECVKGSPHEMNDYKLLIKSFELSTLPNNHTLIRGLDNLSNINSKLNTENVFDLSINQYKEMLKYYNNNSDYPKIDK